MVKIDVNKKRFLKKRTLVDGASPKQERGMPRHP